MEIVIVGLGQWLIGAGAAWTVSQVETSSWVKGVGIIAIWLAIIFAGSVLVIGIAQARVRKHPWRPVGQKTITAAVETSVDIATIPAAPTKDVLEEDALARVVVEGHRPGTLRIQKAFTPWHIAYPLFVSNRRATPINIVGYNINIRWDGSDVSRIVWRAPNANSNQGLPIRASGEPIPFFRIDGDHNYTLEPALNGQQVRVFPTTSPKWSAFGRLYLQANGIEGEVPFNVSDDYILAETDWQTWVTQVESSKKLESYIRQVPP